MAFGWAAPCEGGTQGLSTESWFISLGSREIGLLFPLLLPEVRPKCTLFPRTCWTRSGAQGPWEGADWAFLKTQWRPLVTHPTQEPKSNHNHLECYFFEIGYFFFNNQSSPLGLLSFLIQRGSLVGPWALETFPCCQEGGAGSVPQGGGGGWFLRAFSRSLSGEGSCVEVGAKEGT